MGWFTKSKDKKKKEEEEKKKKAADLQQQQPSSQIQRSNEEQKQNSSQNRQSQNGQIPQQQQEQEEQEQQNLIKEEDVWIFESILQFVSSPVFRGPTNQFLDDKCLYFENTKDISNEHKEIFHVTILEIQTKSNAKDYKTLLDELVISLAQDIGVEPDKIMEICGLGLNFRSQRRYFLKFLIYFHFDDFVKVMAKRNIDLEQQAFVNLQQKGMVPSSQNSQNGQKDDYELAIQNSLSNTQITGDKEFQKAILASQKEFENKKQLQEQEDEMLQQALRISKMESDNTQIKSSIKQDNHSLNKKISKPEQKKQVEDDDDLIQMDDSDDDNLKNDDDNDDDDNLYYDNADKNQANQWNKQGNQQFDDMLFESRQNLLKNLDNLNINQNNNSNQNQQYEENLEERKERIKKQRELLIEKKRKERANQLDEFADKQIHHQELLMQDEEDDTKSQMDIKKKKELMNKIKADIAGNK